MEHYAARGMNLYRVGQLSSLCLSEQPGTTSEWAWEADCGQLDGTEPPLEAGTPLGGSVMVLEREYAVLNSGDSRSKGENDTDCGETLERNETQPVD